jgi:hypothetical protein
MADRGPRPAIEGPGGSPVPEGYGALDDAPARAGRAGEHRGLLARSGDGRGSAGRRSDPQAVVTEPPGGTGPPAVTPRAPAGPPVAGDSARSDRLASPARLGPEWGGDPPTVQVAAAEARSALVESPAARRRLPPAQARRPAPGGAVPGGPPGSPNGFRADNRDLDDTEVTTAQALGPKRRWRRQKVRVVHSTSSRRLVRRVDTWTVFKVSLFFYLLGLAIVIVAGVILWNVASTFGTIASIQKSVRSLFDLTNFVLKPVPLLEYTAAGGGVLALLGTIVNTVAALLYNLISDVAGGVQVVVVTEPD